MKTLCHSGVSVLYCVCVWSLSLTSSKTQYGSLLPPRSADFRSCALRTGDRHTRMQRSATKNIHRVQSLLCPRQGCEVLPSACLSVCLSVCPHAYLTNHISKRHEIFCTCCLPVWGSGNHAHSRGPCRLPHPRGIAGPLRHCGARGSLPSLPPLDGPLCSCGWVLL